MAAHRQRLDMFTWSAATAVLTIDYSPEEKYQIVAGNVIDYFDLDPDLLPKSA